MKNYLFLLSICTLSFFFVGCKETGASTDKKSAPKENPRGKKFLVKAKQYSQEAFLAHKSADKAAKGNASGGSSGGGSSGGGSSADKKPWTNPNTGEKESSREMLARQDGEIKDKARDKKIADQDKQIKKMSKQD